jgi:hypothetical protein
MLDGLLIDFGLGEANAPFGGLSGLAAADTRTKYVQKALMEYLLLGRVNA